MANRFAVIIVVVVLGLLLSLQNKASFALRKALDPQSQEQLSLVVALSFEDNRKLQDQLKQTQEEIGKLKTSATSSRSQRETLQERLNEAELILGEVPVEGEGVEVVFEKGLTTQQAIDLTNALRSIGAEAIGINGKRILWKTGIDEGLLRNSATLQVIGQKSLLAESLKRRGGILEQIGQPNRLSEQDQLKLPSI